MALTKKDLLEFGQILKSEFFTFKQEIRTEIAEAITDNVFPAMDRMHQDLKQEIREVRRSIEMTS